MFDPVIFLLEYYKIYDDDNVAIRAIPETRLFFAELLFQKVNYDNAELEGYRRVACAQTNSNEIWFLAPEQYLDYADQVVANIIILTSLLKKYNVCSTR